MSIDLTPCQVAIDQHHSLPKVFVSEAVEATAMMTQVDVCEHRDHRQIAGETTTTTTGVNLPRTEGAAIVQAEAVAEVMIHGTTLIPGTSRNNHSGGEVAPTTTSMTMMAGALLVEGLREGRGTIPLTTTMVSTMTGVLLANDQEESSTVAVVVVEEAEVEAAEVAAGDEILKVVVAATEILEKATRKRETIPLQTRVLST